MTNQPSIARLSLDEEDSPRKTPSPSSSSATGAPRSEPSHLSVTRTKLGARPSRSMYVPIQKTFYGPKATLKEVSDDYLMLIQDPISMQLKWRQTPTNVFVIKKECDTVFDSFNEFVNYLTNVSNRPTCTNRLKSG